MPSGHPERLQMAARTQNTGRTRSRLRRSPRANRSARIPRGCGVSARRSCVARIGSIGSPTEYEGWRWRRRPCVVSSNTTQSSLYANERFGQSRPFRRYRRQMSGDFAERVGNLSRPARLQGDVTRAGRRATKLAANIRMTGDAFRPTARQRLTAR